MIRFITTTIKIALHNCLRLTFDPLLWYDCNKNKYNSEAVLVKIPLLSLVLIEANSICECTYDHMKWRLILILGGNEQVHLQHFNNNTTSHCLRPTTTVGPTHHFQLEVRSANVHCTPLAASIVCVAVTRYAVSLEISNFDLTLYYNGFRSSYLIGLLRSCDFD